MTRDWRLPGLVLVLLLLGGVAGAGQTVSFVRVHGNRALSSQEVLALARVAAGDAFDPSLPDQIRERLRDSRRFESVEVRVRYRSLDGTGDVGLIVIVRERRLVSDRFLIGPLIRYSEEYGLTFGARMDLVDVPSEAARLSFPLTWGGERQAGAEMNIQLGKFAREDATKRLSFSFGRRRTVHPHFAVPDDRLMFGAAYDVAIRNLQFGGFAEWTDASFDTLEERFSVLGVKAAFDTRIDPTIPGDAVYAGFGWKRLFFESAVERPDVNLYEADFRAYKRLIGQSLLAGQFRLTGAGGPAPPYEQTLLGGGQWLRGHRSGQFIGDNRAVASVELRIPLNELRSFPRAGVHLFYDVGTVYNHGEKLGDAVWYRGVGFGGFFRVAFIGARVDLGWDLEGGMRLHIGSRLKF